MELEKKIDLALIFESFLGGYSLEEHFYLELLDYAKRNSDSNIEKFAEDFKIKYTKEVKGAIEANGTDILETLAKPEIELASRFATDHKIKESGLATPMYLNAIESAKKIKMLANKEEDLVADSAKDVVHAKIALQNQATVVGYSYDFKRI